ncbi:Hypothetical protein UVM_LOCUS217 [uncultured virus]|nr:Hypothetical protein UVM_LOCUS217 [uncultured virus]
MVSDSSSSARVFACAELVRCVGEHADAESLLGLRASSSFLARMLDDADPLFVAAFRRSFPHHTVGRMVPNGWRRRCVRRLRIEALQRGSTRDEQLDLLRWFPLLRLAPTVRLDVSSAALSEWLEHELDDRRYALGRDDLTRLLMWALWRERFDLAQACASRWAGMRTGLADLVKELSCWLCKAVRHDRVSCVDGLLALCFDGYNSPLQGIVDSVVHRALLTISKSTSCFISDTILRRLLSRKFVHSFLLAKRYLKRKSATGDADSVAWLLTQLPSVTVATLLKAVARALHEGHAAVANLLLAVEPLPSLDRTFVADHLLDYLDSFPRDFLKSPTPPLLHEILGFGLRDRRQQRSKQFLEYIAYATNADVAVVSEAVQNHGYRCEPADWNSALESVALNGQTRLLEACLALSELACGQRTTGEAKALRLARAMEADPRRAALLAATAYLWRATAVPALLALFESERPQTSDDNTLHAMHAIIVGAGAGFTRKFIDEKEWTDWLLGSTDRELVLRLLLSEKGTAGRYAGVFRSVLCRSKDVETVSRWLRHVGEDVLLAANVPEYTAPNCQLSDDYGVCLWALELQRAVTLDVFQALVSEPRIYELGHVRCELWRLLLFDGSEEALQRVRVLLKCRRLRHPLPPASASVACQCETRISLQHIYLSLVQQQNAGALRVLLEDGRFDLSLENNAALRAAVWMERPGQAPSEVRLLLEADERVQKAKRVSPPRETVT